MPETIKPFTYDSPTTLKPFIAYHRYIYPHNKLVTSVHNNVTVTIISADMIFTNPIMKQLTYNNAVPNWVGDDI